MADKTYDLVVIGGGPGGYVAAIRAAQLGMSTACVEGRGSLGGTCLNVGSIPSKALLKSSEIYAEALGHLADHGVQVAGVELDLDTMMGRKAKVVKELTTGIEFLLKKNKVDYLRGWGSIPKAGEVLVSGAEGETQTLKTKNILIATGSESSPLPGVEVDEAQIVTSTGALEIPKVPKSMIVIGAGVIGLELGSVWSRLGAKVTVIEFLDRILPGMDGEIAKHTQRVLKKQGIDFKLGRKVTSAEKSADGERDLEAAARVQQSYLPSTLPPTDRAQFAWAYRPCDELAGDIFNVVQIDDRHVGMYVVDVSGHGVPSALLAVSVARNLIPHSDRSALVVEPDADGQEHLVVGPADVASRLNGLYRMDEKNQYYFTLLYGLLETREGLFRYASAGHPGPVRVRPSEPPRMYTQPAIPIGMMDFSTYEEAVIDLRTGDRLYLYSDGVTEETNPDDEPFGDERMLHVLDESRGLTLDESVQSLVESVLSWHGATQLSDDLSVLAVEVQ